MFDPLVRAVSNPCFGSGSWRISDFAPAENPGFHCKLGTHDRVSFDYRRQVAMSDKADFVEFGKLDSQPHR